MSRIHVSEINGKQVLCYHTGLDPRSFARTKMSQSLIEPGFIVLPDGTCIDWKPAAVIEHNDKMTVWGPPFPGERLDLIIKEKTQQAALQAIAFWIRAKLILGEKSSALNPGAAFISTESKNREYAGSFEPLVRCCGDALFLILRWFFDILFFIPVKQKLIRINQKRPRTTCGVYNSIIFNRG